MVMQILKYTIGVLLLLAVIVLVYFYPKLLLLIFLALVFVYPKLLRALSAPIVITVAALFIFEQPQILELFDVLHEDAKTISIFGNEIPISLYMELLSTLLTGFSIYLWARIATWFWWRDYRRFKKSSTKKTLGKFAARVLPLKLIVFYLWIVGSRFTAISATLYTVLGSFIIFSILSDFTVGAMISRSNDYEEFFALAKSYASEVGSTIADAFAEANIFGGLTADWKDLLERVLHALFGIVFSLWYPFSLTISVLSWITYKSGIASILPKKRKPKKALGQKASVLDNLRPVSDKPGVVQSFSGQKAQLPIGGSVSQILEHRNKFTWSNPYIQQGKTGGVSSSQILNKMDAPSKGIITGSGALSGTLFIGGSSTVVYLIQSAMPFLPGIVLRYIIPFYIIGLLLALTFALVPILFLVFLILAVVITFVPSISGSLGTIVLINLFLTVGLTVIGFIARCKRGGTVTVALLVLIGGLAYLDLNDNHRISSLGANISPPLGAEFAFSKWSQRFTESSLQPTPVYIVAAPGGGIYASHQAALMLSHLHDRIPTFSEHLYAISSVSGGSLGAALYVGLTHRQASQTPSAPLVNTAVKYLGKDFLSSSVGMTLFNDLAARFLPCIGPICVDCWDRSRGLEADFVSAWHDTNLGSDWFGGSYYQHWRPADARPAMLINTTRVEDGARTVIAPFRMPEDSSNATTFYEEAAFDLSIATAVGLSARFPGLSPAGWYASTRPGEYGVKRRIVDGGYSDNSGVATALQLIRWLKASQAGKGFRFVLLVLRIDANGQTNAGQGFSEILSPLRTLDSARAARSQEWIEVAKYELGPQQGNAAGDYYELWLDTGKPLPLGWRLSEKTQTEIKRSITRDDCSDLLSFSDSAVGRSCRNAHIVASIQAELESPTNGPQ